MKFNIRVYGVLIFDNRVLLTKEKRFGRSFTKFPGGGLEFKEGTKACLKREFQEELNLSVKVGELIYLNDFYQASAFDSKQQLISIYYYVEPKNSEFALNKLKINNELEEIIWKPIHSLSEDDLTFPVDKYLVNNFLS